LWCGGHSKIQNSAFKRLKHYFPSLKQKNELPVLFKEAAHHQRTTHNTVHISFVQLSQPVTSAERFAFTMILEFSSWTHLINESSARDLGVGSKYLPRSGLDE
jgi:hypothetical protein